MDEDNKPQLPKGFPSFYLPLYKAYLEFTDTVVALRNRNKKGAKDQQFSDGEDSDGANVGSHKKSRGLLKASSVAPFELTPSPWTESRVERLTSSIETLTSSVIDLAGEQAKLTATVKHLVDLYSQQQGLTDRRASGSGKKKA